MLLCIFSWVWERRELCHHVLILLFQKYLPMWTQRHSGTWWNETILNSCSGNICISSTSISKTVKNTGQRMLTRVQIDKLKTAVVFNYYRSLNDSSAYLQPLIIALVLYVSHLQLRAWHEKKNQTCSSCWVYYQSSLAIGTAPFRARCFSAQCRVLESWQGRSSREPLLADAWKRQDPPADFKQLGFNYIAIRYQEALWPVSL